MEPLAGFQLANWEKGFGDFEMRPDLSTLRLLPWQPGAAMVICDLHHPGGKPVEEAPRSVLQRQLESLDAKRPDLQDRQRVGVLFVQRHLPGGVRRPITPA